MRQHDCGVANHDPAMIQNFLEFAGGFGAMVGGQKRLATQIDGVTAVRLKIEQNQLVGVL